jgi:hypothetical protein
MSKFNKIEDINASKESVDLTVYIYKLTNESKDFHKDYGLRDQVQNRLFQYHLTLVKDFREKQRLNLSDFYILPKARVENLEPSYLLHINLDT